MVRATDIDQTLDEVIQKNRESRRKSRFNNYASKRRSNQNYYRPYSQRSNYYNNERSRYSYNQNVNRARRAYSNLSQGIKLMTNPNITKMNISNLEFGVTQGDMRELFGSVGKLKHVALHFDKNGRSQGTCEIIFERREDALTAYNQYNGVPLDGRSMLLELMGEPLAYQGNDERRGGYRQRGNFRDGHDDTRGEAPSRVKKEISAEALDKELDAYLTKGAKSK